MIKHLYIKNFVLIDELNLDFESGFSVFTGETGAGKSILIDAISLLSNERASVSYIMKGKDKAIIEGTFDLSHSEHAKNVLNEAGFDVIDEVTFTREIHSSGKSVARIDHRIVTLSLMKDCLMNEIDIHGQRDNAYLLNTGLHIHLLDRYLQIDDVLMTLKNAYEEYDRLYKEREQALEDTYNESDIEFFQYQINEIEEAALEPGEDTVLEEKENNFKAIKESYDKLAHIISLYNEQIGDNYHTLNRMVQNLDDANEELISIKKNINDSYYVLSDAMESLDHLFNSYDMSEEDINHMEERLFIIQRLKRKYGKTIEEILEKKDEFENRIEIITHKQEYLEKMNQKVEQAYQRYLKAADEVSEIRKNRFNELDNQIQSVLKDLMLEHAKFQTNITKSKDSVYGYDHVEFLISMNPGESLKPLSKTASGGELSRLMLGLKVIFTKIQGIKTVIFDEIDTGVSGPVATAIGHKMKELGQDCQVFSVTHLAQVAACSQHHYFVHKNVDGDSTKTYVDVLDEKGRIDQLALISSGEITDISKKAAKELLRRNSQ